MTAAGTVRKRVTLVETIETEVGRPVEPPLRIGISAVVMTNPWIGRGFVEDLGPEIRAIAPNLGRSMTQELLVAMGVSGEQIQAYGKAGVVGLDGELEHASAIIHTLRFGNVFRDAVSGTSYLPFTNLRAAAAVPIVIPLVHKEVAGRRSHFLTASLTLTDAPAPGELVVAIAAATGGRPFERIGDRTIEIQEMGLAGERA